MLKCWHLFDFPEQGHHHYIPELCISFPGWRYLIPNWASAFCIFWEVAGCACLLLNGGVLFWPNLLVMFLIFVGKFAFQVLWVLLIFFQTMAQIALFILFKNVLLYFKVLFCFFFFDRQAEPIFESCISRNLSNHF